MAAIDYNNWKMLMTSRSICAMKPDAKQKTVTQRHVLNNALSRGGRAGCLCVEAVNKVLSVCSDGPLSWVFRTVKNDPVSIPPSGRSKMLRFNLATSPINTRVLELCNLYRQRKERAIVFVNSPHTQAVLVALLAKASFGVATIRSHMKVHERNKYIKDFNSLRSDVDVFVLNTDIHISGLNLHRQCSNAIVAFPAWNHDTISKAIDTVFRVDQKKAVEVRILKVVDSVFAYLECRADIKYVHQVMHLVPKEAGEAPLLKMLVGFEIISIRFGTHPFNHFSWVAEPPQSVVEFYSDRQQRMGEFYSALVSLILKGRPDDEVMSHTRDCVLDFLRVLGPAWIDREYQAEFGGRMVQGKVKSIPMSLEPANVTWDRIRLVMAWIQSNYNYYEPRSWVKMIGVPDSWTALNPFIGIGLMDDKDAEPYPQDFMRHDLSDLADRVGKDAARPWCKTYAEDEAAHERQKSAAKKAVAASSRKRSRSASAGAEEGASKRNCRK
ncbi:hypothetical protein RB600_007516 [Gaeumannomyces tritici]